MKKLITIFQYFSSRISRADFALFWCIVLVQALLWSKFLISLCGISLLVISFLKLEVIDDKKFRLTAPPQYRCLIFDFFQQKTWVSVGILFFLAVLSLFWSSDLNYGISRVRLYLPFFTIPLAFFVLPKFNAVQYRAILIAALSAGFLLGAFVLVRYALNFELMNKKLLMGQPIATPIDHINFNFALVMCFLSGIELLQNFYSKKSFSRNIILFSLIFLFLTEHILAVRGGILAMYICLLYWGGYQIWKTRRWKLGISALVGIGLLASLAVQFTPSLRNRIQFMVWDWGQFRAGNAENNSDSERLISLHVGMDVLRQSPLVGVGVGDVWANCESIYAQKHPTLDPKLPHSQFILVGAATGWLGIVVFLICFFTPIVVHWREGQPFLVATHLLFFISFFFEALSEASLSVVLFSFWVGLQLNYLKKSVKN